MALGVLAAVAALMFLARRWQVARGGGGLPIPAWIALWTLWWAELLVRLLLPDALTPTSDEHSTGAWRSAEPGIPELERLRIPRPLLSLDGRQVRREPGTWRILVIGDSFAAGEGVNPGEDAASRVAARLAEVGPGPRTEVLNHGLSGLSFWEEAALFEDHSRWWQPDVVVWMFVLNDLGSSTPIRERLPAGAEHAYDDHIVDRTLANHVGTGSALVDLVAVQWRRHRVGRVMETSYQARYDPIRSARQLDELQTRLHRLVSDQRDRGGRFLFTVWPLLHQLDAYPFSEANDTLLKLAATAGAETVDLLPIFAGRQERDLWASPTDHHPNALGQSLAAEAIARAILSRPSLPAALISCAALPSTATADMANVVHAEEVWTALDQALSAGQGARARELCHRLSCLEPGSPRAALAAARVRLLIGPANEPSPFSERPLVAVSLHEAIARTRSPDDPIRQEVATVARQLLTRPDGP